MTACGIDYGARAAKAALLDETGRQDSRVILPGPEGEAEDFVMNGRYAAGTGRFPVVISEIPGTIVRDLSQLAPGSVEPTRA